MALKPCKECKKEISTSAKSCPNCGVKNPTTTAKDLLVGTITLLVLVFIVYSFWGGSDEDAKPKKTEEEIAAETAACKKDFNCWSEKGFSAATVMCKSHIEKLANYSFEWTDGMLDTKFSRSAWANKEAGTIMYIGDKIKFQNGFGAWQNHIYSCVLDPETRAVLSVEATPGTL